MSTVLEQDHFYSVYLVSHVTVLTNSRNHDDELFLLGQLESGTRVPFLERGTFDADEPTVFFCGHKRLSDSDYVFFFDYFFFTKRYCKMMAMTPSNDISF